MLYRLDTATAGGHVLSALPFSDFHQQGLREKDLENLLGRHLLEVLFEEAPLMPVFQERSWQAEADLYALDEHGNLVLFELKRSDAGEDAVQQALRYLQTAGQWSYEELEQRYREYTGAAVDLAAAHQEAFALEHPLQPRQINARQHAYVVGSAADSALQRAIGYWQRQGLRIDFLPYRIYELHGERYFEFFSPPHDQHRNPADRKGVIFDTNRSWDEQAIWYMLDNGRVAAFGDAARYVERLAPGDLVFLSHRWTGLVAAARVRPAPVKDDGPETRYRDVEFLTPLPKSGSPLLAMPFARVAEITGHGFFWARTVKVPYLELEESEKLLQELQRVLAPQSTTG